MSENLRITITAEDNYSAALDRLASKLKMVSEDKTQAFQTGRSA